MKVDTCALVNMDWIKAASEYKWTPDLLLPWEGVASVGACLSVGVALAALWGRDRTRIPLRGKVIFITGCDSGFG